MRSKPGEDVKDLLVHQGRGGLYEVQQGTVIARLLLVSRSSGRTGSSLPKKACFRSRVLDASTSNHGSGGSEGGNSTQVFGTERERSEVANSCSIVLVVTLEDLLYF